MAGKLMLDLHQPLARARSKHPGCGVARRWCIYCRAWRERFEYADLGPNAYLRFRWSILDGDEDHRCGACLGGGRGGFPLCACRGCGLRGDDPGDLSILGRFGDCVSSV